MKNVYRIKFYKLDKMIFIGHLDILKIFIRAIKLSNINIAYSEGFNPHQKISFAMPLPLGFKSFGEYVDIILKEKTDPLQIFCNLNKNLPEGMQVVDVKEVDENEKNSASILFASSYIIQLDLKKQHFEKLNIILDNLMILPEVLYTKDEKTINLKEYIHELKHHDTIIKTKIASGSNKNLKPQILVDYIYQKLDLEYDAYNISYTRLDMFKWKNHKLTPLFD